MPQGPIAVAVSNFGGTLTKLNITAATVIKAVPGKVFRIVVVNGGTASNGSFTLNDCATTGAAAASNEFFTLASGAAAGSAFEVDWPCLTGIVVSAVPSAGSPVLAVSYS